MDKGENLTGYFTERKPKGVFLPFARLSFLVDGTPSREIDAYLDTGAFGILIEIPTARSLLKLRDEQIKANPKQELGGCGAKKFFAYRCPTHVRLRATTASHHYVTWKDVPVYASEADLPLPALIGQLGGLQGGAFVHLNRTSRSQKQRHWKLFRPLKNA